MIVTNEVENLDDVMVCVAFSKLDAATSRPRRYNRQHYSPQNPGLAGGVTAGAAVIGPMPKFGNPGWAGVFVNRVIQINGEPFQAAVENAVKDKK